MTTFRLFRIEELGSVYESLLDFEPNVVEADPERPELWDFQLGAGGGRKSSGSYYTPRELVQELIGSALVPVLEQRLKDAGRDPVAREQALLSMTVIDPAAGSGHFLLAAARRIARELAKVRTGEAEPAPAAIRDAMRDVVPSCIYGVDKNPMAVDLCKVGLWIEGHAPGRPLSFLDHHIKHGDSLIGVYDLDVLQDGVYKVRTSDDVRSQHRAQVNGIAMAASREHPYFHWPLEFPDVFEEGGFDVVLGNPPWERYALQEKEWFASRDADVANARNAAARKRAIVALRESNPTLHAEFESAKHLAEAQSEFTRASGRFPLGAVGQINLYQVFIELDRALLGPAGRAGVISPTGLATDNNTKDLFGDFVQKGNIVSFFDFENRRKLFSDVDSRLKFAIITLASEQCSEPSEFAFFLFHPTDLADDNRRFTPWTRTSGSLRSTHESPIHARRILPGGCDRCLSRNRHQLSEVVQCQ